MFISLQLYSIKEEVALGFEKAFSMAAEAGYGGVEFAGYYDQKACDIRALLDAHALKAVSAHVGLDLLKNDLARQIDYAKALGFDLIICPFTSCKTKEACLQDAADLEKIARTAAKSGVTIGYHNHNQEFAKFDGRFAMDIMLDAMPSVKFEPDVYWIEHAGVDSVAYVTEKANAGRLCALHAKEIAKTGQDNVYIGDGRIDFASLAKAAPPEKFPWVVEQEHFSSPHEDGIKKSAAGLKRALKI